jgi:hypothetical protein
LKLKNIILILSSFKDLKINLAVQKIENNWSQIYNFTFTLAELQQMTIYNLLTLIVGMPNVGIYDIRFLDSFGHDLYVRNVSGFRHVIIQLATTDSVRHLFVVQICFLRRKKY